MLNLKTRQPSRRPLWSQPGSLDPPPPYWCVYLFTSRSNNHHHALPDAAFPSPSLPITLSRLSIVARPPAPHLCVCLTHTVRVYFSIHTVFLSFYRFTSNLVWCAHTFCLLSTPRWSLNIPALLSSLSVSACLLPAPCSVLLSLYK